MTFLNTIDVQGHRGCRGLYPENSIEGFIAAIDIGVNTLEMDVVITKDLQVLVSHEPFLAHEICLGANGIEIDKNNARSFNLFNMTYEEIKSYDCGSKNYPRFAQQKKIKTHKPLLNEVFAAVQNHLTQTNKRPVFYNIEIKSSPQNDKVFHPEVSVFADLLMDVVKPNNLEGLVTIQSFHVRALKYMHEKYPHVPLALLIENKLSLDDNLKLLGFKPNIYSPFFKLINRKTVKQLHDLDIKVIPWTVNETQDIEHQIKIGVDGIISDYPDRVTAIANKLQ